MLREIVRAFRESRLGELRRDLEAQRSISYFGLTEDQIRKRGQDMLFLSKQIAELEKKNAQGT